MPGGPRRKDRQSFSFGVLKGEILDTLKANAAALDMPTTTYIMAILEDAVKSGRADSMAIRRAGENHKKHPRAHGEPLRWKNLKFVDGNLWKVPGRWMHVDDFHNIWILEKIAENGNQRAPRNDREGWYLHREGSSAPWVKLCWKITDAKLAAERIIRQHNRDTQEGA